MRVACRLIWSPGGGSPAAYCKGNLGLRNAMLQVFGVEAKTFDFLNARKRPDLVILPSSSISGVASEDIHPDTNVATVRRVLLGCQRTIKGQGGHKLSGPRRPPTARHVGQHRTHKQCVDKDDGKAQPGFPSRPR